MRRASFIAAVGAALVAAGSGAGAPTPADRPSPQVAIFYYAWYGTPRVDGAWQHWGQGQHTPPQDIGSAYYPARGPYSSTAASVVRSQMREIAATGIDTVIVSWWGPGSVEDARLRPVAAAARAAGLGVALHVEPWAGRTPAEVVDGLRGLNGLGIRDVYVYDSTDSPDEDWRERPPGRRRAGASRLRTHVAPREGAARRLSGPLHVRRAPLRRQVVREDVRERASARAPLRPVDRTWLRRVSGDGRRPRSRSERRAVVRPHVAVGAPGDAGRRDDHQLQRMARGHADRARSRRSGRSTRPTTGPGASRASRPSVRTSTALPTGSTGCGASWSPRPARRDRCRALRDLSRARSRAGAGIRRRRGRPGRAARTARRRPRAAARAEPRPRPGRRRR